MTRLRDDIAILIFAAILAFTSILAFYGVLNDYGRGKMSKLDRFVEQAKWEVRQK
jgi:hypothetical protein